MNYKIESKNLENNQILIQPATTKQIVLELTSLNKISSKYELYYIVDDGIDIEIGYNMNTIDSVIGEIAANEIKK